MIPFSCVMKIERVITPSASLADISSRNYTIDFRNIDIFCEIPAIAANT